MKWILVIVTVVALIYLFAGSKAAQAVAPPSGGKTIDGKGKDVLINSTAQAGNTVNDFTPVMANSPTSPQMTLLVVQPQPFIEQAQTGTSSNLKFVTHG